MAYIDDETRERIKKESRLFDLTDVIWAVLIGTLVAYFGINLLNRLHVFDKAVLDTFLGQINLVGNAIGLSRIGAFLVTALIVLVVRYNKRHEK